MELYVVLRAEHVVADDNRGYEAFVAQVLTAGNHNVGRTNGKFSIPVTVEKDRVVIHVSQATGDLEACHLNIVDDGIDIAFLGKIVDISFAATKDVVPLQLYSGDGYTLNMEWRESPPEVFQLPTI